MSDHGAISREAHEPSPRHVLAGVYRHYKGPLYLVMGLGFDANYDDRGDAVIYVPLYTRPDQPGPRLTVRTARDFFAELDPETGMLWSEHLDIIKQEGHDCVCDGPVKRFAYLGPTYLGPDATA